MKLYLISGFLGSGKTTTIIGLSRLIMDKGLKAGVVTNDQGKFLVDTAFMKASDIPAVDVQSGCFCSNYQDLVKQLEELREKVAPDIVFAESIGSSGNLVGTVMKPLLKDSEFTPSSLTALVDARLLLRLIRGEYLPFSDSVTATFKNQLTESDGLIINKIDLLSSEDIKTLTEGLPQYLPGKEYIFQSAVPGHKMEATYEFITRLGAGFKEDPFFDAGLHRKALDRLKWDEEVRQLSSDTNVRHDIEALILDMLSDLRSKHNSVAHIKVLVETPGQSIKLSITSLDNDNWRNELQKIDAKDARVIINSRVHVQ